MLLIGLTSFLIAIPLYSSTITPTLLTRITSIILLFSAAISFNSLYVQAIGSGLGLYSGLFHVTTVTQFMEMFLYVIGACILLGYAVPITDRKEASYNQSLPLLPLSQLVGNSAGGRTKGESKDQMMDIISSTASAGVPRLSLSNQGASFPTSGERGETDYPLSRSLSAVPSIAEYPLIIMFTTIGASLLISSGDLVSMYLSIELQSFAVYILAAIYRNSESATSAGLKYFLLGALSSALILLGSSLIYAYTGLTHFEGIYMISNCDSQAVSDSLENLNQLGKGDVASIPQALLGEGVSSFPNFFPADVPQHSWGKGTGNHSDISPLGETSSAGDLRSPAQSTIGKGASPAYFDPHVPISYHSDLRSEWDRIGISWGIKTAVEQGIVLGVLIIGVGFLFKVAAAPFHNWAPDVYDGVPTIVTTWLTVMPKISIFLFLLELQLSIGDANGPLLGMMMEYPLGEASAYSPGYSDSSIAGDRNMGKEQQESFNLWRNLLLTTSLLSLVIGTVVGLAQYRLKRLLAFSTISHVGFLLLALSVNSEESITSFLFYLMQYSITNLDAFLVVLAFGYLSVTGVAGKDISFISQLKGQFHANPILGLSLAICLFSMAGIPPLVGFFAKYMVLYSAIENGYYFLSFVGILASVISAAYYLRIIRVIHFDVAGDRRSPAPDNSESSKVNYNQLGIFPIPLPNQLGTRDRKGESAVTSAHSYVIAVLTLFILLFLISPSLWLNSSNLLALSLFTA